jgi:BASS family bile acid:Na+ symporter
VTATKLVSGIMLVSIMLNAGLQCNRAHLAAVLKDFGLIVRAVLANFIIVPLVALLMVRALHLDTYVAIGVLLMAIAPGAPFLPRAAGRKPGGSLGLAIALSFILPALSVITIPITASLILPTVGGAQVPASSFISTLLIFQLLPLVIGIIAGAMSPPLAKRLERPLVIIFFLAVLVLLGFLAGPIVKAVASVYGSRGLIAALVTVLVSVIAGWLLGGSHVEYRRTLGIATGLRNIGLCALIASSDFRETLVAPTVICYFLVQFIVTFIFRQLMHRYSQTPAGGAIP